jgi:hypothetical protein
VRLYEISRNLYVSGHPKERDVPKLLEAGITSIICLSKKPTPPEVLAHVLCGAYMPIPDGKTVPVEQLRVIVGTILSQLLNPCVALADGCDEHVVLVHCLQGRNRSMLAAALAARQLEGWTGLEAWDHVTKLRPSSLHNQVFADYLRSLP